MCYAIDLSKRPADTPMLIAVSILSPVKTQTLIPTFFMNWMVSATWSWSLSSIAVEPINSRSISISSSIFATSSSLLVKDSLALFDFSNHFMNSSSSTYLSARYRVLNPSDAYLSTSFYVLAKIEEFLEFLDNLSSMTLSAPLHIRIILFYGSRNMQLIRLRSLVNSWTERSS